MAEQSAYVTLVSSDGYEFVIQRSAACVSGAIKRMLDPNSKMLNVFTWIIATTFTGGFAESTTGVCRFENIK